ncbi:MAG: cache domain-containing protein [Rhodoplanes sp.]|uniref:cache domain-containing protein n=1 Tax=Rhodoplanes sp. TaxID=1968906 RepID=UPI0018480EAB|nr:cache domain-containing protein [Rhodoplanes sp.]NVO16339.1 cache domain-containing protein [Rhodoplanes sp.]
MHRFLTVLVALAGLLVFTSSPRAEGSTPEQAKAFVEKAVAYYKTAGKEKALAVFSDPKGEFVEGDLYVFAMDAADGKLTMLAHGANKGLIGKPQIDMKDAEGKAFNQEMAAAIAKGDTAWVDYKWPNPATKKIASKRSYIVKVGDVVIGAGVYN